MTATTQGVALFPATIGDITIEVNGPIVVVRRTDHARDLDLASLSAVHGDDRVAEEVASIIASRIAGGACIEAAREATWEPMFRALRHFTYANADRQRQTQLDSMVKVHGVTAAWQADGAARDAHAKKLAGVR